MVNFWVGLLQLLSCSEDIDTYHITIKNQYFEPLINCKIGSISVDTLLVD